MTDPVDPTPPKSPRKRSWTKKDGTPAPRNIGARLEAEAAATGGKKRGQLVKSKHAKIGKPNHRIRSYVEHLATGLSPAQANIAAGFNYADGSQHQRCEPLNRPYVRDMLQVLRNRTAEEHKITRAQVLEGLKEAINMARVQSDPAVMIAGWKEIGKMCGFYEAVKVKVDVSNNALAFSAKLMQMSEEELLKLANGETIEGEVVHD